MMAMCDGCEANLRTADPAEALRWHRDHRCAEGEKPAKPKVTRKAK